MPETTEKKMAAKNETKPETKEQSDPDPWMEPEDTVEIIDGEAIKDRERMVPVRLLYLSRELKKEKPCVDEVYDKYGEAAATWIDNMLQEIEGGFCLAEMLKKKEKENKKEIKTLFDGLRQKLKEGGDSWLKEAWEALPKPGQFDMTEFWDKEYFGGKHDFSELFDWMQESLEFIAEKIENKIEVTEGAVQEVNKFAQEFFKNIFGE